MKYQVGYSEIFTGTVVIEADTEREANDKVLELIDSKVLVPVAHGDGHEVVIDFAQVVS